MSPCSRAIRNRCTSHNEAISKRKLAMVALLVAGRGHGEGSRMACWSFDWCAERSVRRRWNAQRRITWSGMVFLPEDKANSRTW